MGWLSVTESHHQPLTWITRAKVVISTTLPIRHAKRTSAQPFPTRSGLAAPTVRCCLSATMADALFSLSDNGHWFASDSLSAVDRGLQYGDGLKNQKKKTRKRPNEPEPAPTFLIKTTNQPVIREP